MRALATAAALLFAAAAGASTLTVTVDPRLELLGAVRQLAVARLDPARPPDPEVTAAFGRLKDHPAVSAYAERLGGPGPDVYGHIALYLTPPPELKWARDPAELSGDFIRRAGGRDAVERWLSQLRDFARKSGFAAFEAGRVPRHEALVRAASAEFADYDYLGAVERYMGRPLESRMSVLLTPLYEPQLAYIAPYPYGGPGKRRRGPYEVFVSVRPPAGGEPFFPHGPFRRGVFNEYFYAYVDGIRTRYADAADDRTVFAIVVALSDRLSRERAAALLAAEPGWKRLWLRLRGAPPDDPEDPAGADPALRARLGRRLAGYESARSRWPDFESFFPRLLDARQ